MKRDASEEVEWRTSVREEVSASEAREAVENFLPLMTPDQRVCCASSAASADDSTSSRA